MMGFICNFGEAALESASPCSFNTAMMKQLIYGLLLYVIGARLASFFVFRETHSRNFITAKLVHCLFLYGV